MQFTARSGIHVRECWAAFQPVQCQSHLFSTVLSSWRENEWLSLQGRRSENRTSVCGFRWSTQSFQQHFVSYNCYTFLSSHKHIIPHINRSALVTAEKWDFKCNLHCVTYQLDSFLFPGRAAVYASALLMMCLPVHWEYSTVHLHI